MGGGRYLFAVYENGEKIFEGNSYQVGERFGLAMNSVNCYARRGCVLNKRYTIEHIGSIKPDEKEQDDGDER